MNRESNSTPELDAGITIAKVGNRYLARQNLNRLAEEYADNPNYWIWMAWLSESISEMNYALERVLALDPENATAQAGLEWAKRLSILAQIHTNRNASGLFKNDLPWQSLMTTLGKNRISLTPQADEPASDATDSLDGLSDDGHSWEEIQRQEFPQLNGAEFTEIAPILDEEAAESVEPASEISQPSETVEVEVAARQLVDQSDVSVEPITEPEEEFNDEPASDLDSSAVRYPRHNYSPERENSTILILEHSPTIRKLLRLTLAQSGYRVVTAASEGDAVNAIARHNPDLIVVDTEMPGGDGYRICKKVRRSPDARRIELVLLSEREGTLEKLRRRRLGCSDYLSKPFAPMALLDSVDRKIACSASQAN